MFTEKWFVSFISLTNLCTIDEKEKKTDRCFMYQHIFNGQKSEMKHDLTWSLIHFSLLECFITFWIIINTVSDRHHARMYGLVLLCCNMHSTARHTVCSGNMCFRILRHTKPKIPLFLTTGQNVITPLLCLSFFLE